MKVSTHFQTEIQSYLEQRAEYDELFARSYRNPLKNIDDETDIEVGKPIDCKVIVNHHVELTEEEKTEARKEAIKRAENEAYSRMTKRKTAPKKESINSNNGQMTLLF